MPPRARALLTLFLTASLALLTPAAVQADPQASTPPPSSTVGAQGHVAQGAAKPANRLRIGSFNIRQTRLDPVAGAPWSERRYVAARDILKAKLDVVGLQEAYQHSDPPQYDDLRDRVNEAGGTYAIVDEDIDTTRDLRILYNTSTLTVVDNGFYQFQVQSGPKQNYRFLAWAVFQVNATGQQFFFSNTHLVHDNPPAAQAQWREIIPMIRSLSGSLPVIHVGDHQTARKPGTPASTMMRRMKQAGFGDVVGAKSGEYRIVHPRAKRLVNARISSFNNYQRRVADFSTGPGTIANSPDWIFASNNLKVKLWKVWANIRNGRVVGTLPSDHFLVSSTIELPYS